MIRMLRATPRRWRPIICSKKRPNARKKFIKGPRPIPHPADAGLLSELIRRSERSRLWIGGVTVAGETVMVTRQIGSFAMQPLTIALGNYGITKPIKEAGADLG